MWSLLGKKRLSKVNCGQELRNKTKSSLVLAFINNFFSQSLFAFSSPIYLCVRGVRKFYIKVQLCNFCATWESFCIGWKAKANSQSLWVSSVFVEGRISKSLIWLRVGGPNILEFKEIHQQWCSWSDRKTYCRKDTAYLCFFCAKRYSLGEQILYF